MTKAVIFIGKKGQTAVDAVAARSEAVLANYGQSLLVRAEEDALAALAQEGFRIRQLPDTASTRIGAFEVDTSSVELRSTSASPMVPALPSGRTHQVVGLAGPMHPDWKSQLSMVINLNKSRSVNSRSNTEKNKPPMSFTFQRFGVVFLICAR